MLVPFSQFFHDFHAREMCQRGQSLKTVRSLGRDEPGSGLKSGSYACCFLVYFFRVSVLFLPCFSFVSSVCAHAV